LFQEKALALTAREQVEAVRTVASMKSTGVASALFTNGAGGVDTPVRLQTDVEN
jgi:hypothetical protein